MNIQPKFVYVTLIETSPEKLWTALTSPEFTRQYWFDTSVESDWQIGSPVRLQRGDITNVDGIVLKSEPPRLLSFTFHDLMDEEARAEKPSRVTYEIEPLTSKRGPAVKLTVTHDDFPLNSVVLPKISGGWPMLLSSLKTLLETGSALVLDMGSPCTKS